ncbi:MAG: hypothetical protein ACYDHM_06835 [Acidiferrobacterales bacterium]
MSAFNRRYEPREIFGVPLITAIAAVAALPLILFTLLLPPLLKPLTAVATLIALALAAAGLWLGDERPFLAVMLAARRERDRVTGETRTDG